MIFPVLTFGQEVELIWLICGQRQTLVPDDLSLSECALSWNSICRRHTVNVPTIPLIDGGWVRFLTGLLVQYDDCHRCLIMYLTQDWMSIVVNAILDVIIITRLHAMYQRSRQVLILLIVVFLFVNLFNGVVAAISVRNVSGAHWRIPEELILSGTYQCSINFEGDVPLLYSITWIFATIWEVLALCLAIWIAVKHFRELRRQSAGGIIGDCFTVLMKTHVGYFAIFVTVSCFQLIFFFSPSLEDGSSLEAQIFNGFLAIFTVVQMFVLGPRLILGVREYHAKLVADSDTATAMTSIAFQERVSMCRLAAVCSEGDALYD
ncbi:hypothetical protein DFH29DRAFT_1074126 [Suillus ampliporus]|nr:hypothetical protein DFH29DRAFT_1074126 [Suillus ampliporus]